jgi:hypothetical protein
MGQSVFADIYLGALAPIGPVGNHPNGHKDGFTHRRRYRIRDTAHS